MHRSFTATPRLLRLILCALLALPPAAAAGATEQAAAAAGDPGTALRTALQEGEEALRDGEPQIAESRYRSALLEGWLLLGRLRAAGGDLEGALDAFRAASRATVETRRPYVSLALVHLQRGEAEPAVDLLRDLRARLPRDGELGRLLAQALAAAGQPEQAMQELAEAVAAAPGDLESAFALATGHLRAGDEAAAAELFRRIAAARPAPQTHVLLGRTWRDFGAYPRARRALETALEIDPQVRRARYYLGTVALLADGRAGLEQAVEHFEGELALDPDPGAGPDPVVHLHLGMALVELRRFEAALAPLRHAADAAPTRRDALHFLGKALTGLGRTGEAVTAYRRAVELAESAAEGGAAGPEQLSSLHYGLAQALRRQGDEAAAAPHFAAAERWTRRLTDNSRDRLAAYLGDTGGAAAVPAPFRPRLDVSDLAALPEERRRELAAAVTTAVGRSYFNLGVLQARRRDHRRAATFLAEAAAVAPELPGVQRALGIARFNAGAFADAVGPLRRVWHDHPHDAALRRMLALAHLNAAGPGDHAAAADLLADNPGRAGDRSLEYAYALALVRAGRAGEAEPVFRRLLTAHADWAELHVLLGQAHAEQGDWPAAVGALERALELDPGVAEAHGSLGFIHLRRGELEAAAAALRRELEHHPGDVRARHHLATVLDLDNRPEEAAALLRALLDDHPDHADARYLLGKILLGRGEAESAVEQLEAAARLAPQEPEIHYQLGQAYRRLGRDEAARREIDRFRTLKAQQREATP